MVARQADTVDWVLGEVRALGWGLIDAPEGHVLDALLQAANAMPGEVMLLVDSYRVDGVWLGWARARFPGPLVVVDDLGDRAISADVVLNQNVTADRVVTRTDATAVYLLGPRYALLRPEFARAREQALAPLPDGEPRNVLVVMGGTDPTGSARVVGAACLEAFSDADVLVVTPEGWGARSPRLRTVPRIGQMATALVDCDLVVTAAGSTLWEAFCLGRPVAALRVADNQTDVYTQLVGDGIVLGLGSVPASIGEVALSLAAGLSDPGTLRRLGRAGGRLVDGRGTERVAEAIDQAMERWSNARG